MNDFELREKRRTALESRNIAMMSPFSSPDNITGAHLSTIFPLKSMTHFFWSMASFLLDVAAAGESRQAHLAAEPQVMS